MTKFKNIDLIVYFSTPWNRKINDSPYRNKKKYEI